MNIGLEIVSALLNGGDIKVLLDAGFNTTWLNSHSSGSGVIFSGPDKNSYQFILKHYERHRVVPKLSIFRSEFPESSYTLSESPPSLVELTELANSRIKSYLTADLISRAIDYHDSGKPENALSVMASEAPAILSATAIVDSAVDIADSSYDIEELLSLSMEEGIPFGIPLIDDEFFGFQPGQLITLVGRQKSGKTFLTVNSAYHAWRKGYSVLFFSVEMSTDLLKQRFYSLGAHVSNGRMRRGTLRDTEKEKVRAFKREMEKLDSELPRFIVSEKKSMITLDDIEAEVKKHNPHIVYVDGFSFMIDRRTNRMTDDWQANENVAAELKAFAMENSLTVFVNTQAQEKQFSSSKGIEGRLIQGGTGLLKASDLVLGLTKDADVMTVNTILSRFEHPPTVYVEADWEHTEFLMMQAALEGSGI